MALVNQAKQEINSKLVFFGPGLAGKGTNLRHVYNKLKPEFRGAMKAMNVQNARMLFFDFTPPGDGNVEGFRVRFHVYTVSGPVVDPSAWKMVLKGVDGVVFVADSAPEREAENRESLNALSLYLKGYGESLSLIPLVFQYNKSDLPGALPQAELERTLNPSGNASFRASSQSGEGVLPTILGLAKTVLSRLREKGVQGIAASIPGSSGTPAPQEPVTQGAPGNLFGEEAQAPRAMAPEATASPAAASPGVTPPPAASDQSGFGATGGEAEEEPLSVELSGVPESAGPGLIRLPITVRSGARSRSVVLSVALSLEEG